MLGPMIGPRSWSLRAETQESVLQAFQVVLMHWTTKAASAKSWVWFPVQKGKKKKRTKAKRTLELYNFGRSWKRISKFSNPTVPCNHLGSSKNPSTQATAHTSPVTVCGVEAGIVFPEPPAHSQMHPYLGWRESWWDILDSHTFSAFWGHEPHPLAPQAG